jgi:hypothetical protein
VVEVVVVMQERQMLIQEADPEVREVGKHTLKVLVLGVV